MPQLAYNALITTLATALEAAAVGAGHLFQRLAGDYQLIKNNGISAIIHPDYQDEMDAATPEGRVRVERRFAQKAGDRYNQTHSDSDRIGYQRSLETYKKAVVEAAKQRAEDAAAEKLGEGNGNTIGDVLAPKGPKGKSADEMAKEAEEARKREVDRQKRVADQDARLDDEYLSARSELTANTDEQAAIARERLAAATKAKLADLDSQIADGRVKGGQNGAEATGIRDRIQRNAYQDLNAINRRSNTQDEQDAFALANARLDSLRDELGSQESLATTMKERREIELSILAAEKENERLRLQAISDDKYRPKGDRHYSDEQITEADEGLGSLNNRYAGKEAVVKQQTASPLEAYEKQLKEETGSIHEQLQTLEVDAIQKLGDHFADAATKALHLHGVLGSIVGDLIKMAEKDLILGLLKSASGSGGIFGKIFGGGHADGGPVSPDKFYLVGERGPELFAPTGSGNIVPNHALPRTIIPAGVPSAREIGAQRQQAMQIQVHVAANDYFDAHVTSIADGRVNSAAPAIANAGSVKAAKDAARRRGRTLGTRG
jgi:hypothetical protein